MSRLRLLWPLLLMIACGPPGGHVDAARSTPDTWGWATTSHRAEDTGVFLRDGEPRIVIDGNDRGPCRAIDGTSLELVHRDLGEVITLRPFAWDCGVRVVRVEDRLVLRLLIP